MRTATSHTRKHGFAYPVLAALFLLVMTAFVRNVSDTVDLVRHDKEYVRALLSTTT